MGQILIADDEENILGVMVDVLENAGHDVTGVSDGIAALEELKKKTYDVALIDVMMPKMDGYHVAAQIHGLPHPPKIVIVTSRSFEGDKQILARAGVDAFLPKPFANHDLVKVVAELLNKKGLK
jgi:CheY-like chemotaxis protein